MMRRLPGPQTAVLALILTALVAGAAAWPFRSGLADLSWAAGTVAALLPGVWRVTADLRQRRYGADLLAVLALAGTLVVGEYLAGAVIALMVATGQILEAAATGKAGRDLSGLAARMPSVAHLDRGGVAETVAAEQVRPGDLVVVFAGEIVPVDGKSTVDGLLDESALTGEAAPVPCRAGELVRSGVVNAGPVLRIRASATAAASTYAGVVRLAEHAAAGTAPVVRLADRAAVWFLPAALIIAGLAWLLSGDPVRAVAVLVTATPCPLLLAVPIAITGGMSRAARSGVVVKGGGVLELLGHARTVVLDKTGTVTEGRPEVTAMVTDPDFPAERALRYAAGIEQYSAHVLAGAVLRAARRNGVEPARAGQVTERPGEGVEAVVDGHQVLVGRRPQGTVLPRWGHAAEQRGRLDLATLVWVVVDGVPVSAMLLRDRLRPDAQRTMRRLRAAGLRRIVLLTGDRLDNAQEVAIQLGLDEVKARATPPDKIDCVRAERDRDVTVMVGDGINDAPALAAADAGIALGARGSAAAVAAAGAVIVDDRLDRLADAVEIARRARRLAVQSAAAGIGLSLLAMGAAAAGLLLLLAGAIAQEAIDLAAIGNALRVLRQPPRRGRSSAEALLRRFASEHTELEPVRAAVRHAADALAEGATPAADAAVRRTHRLLATKLLPHEQAEERELYPALARILGGPASTTTMSRAHAEIGRLIRRVERDLAEAPEQIQPDQIDDLRATLYGLDAILTLHFCQEEEAYFTLVPDRATDPA